MEENTNSNNFQSDYGNGSLGYPSTPFVPQQNNGEMGSYLMNNNPSQQGPYQFNPYSQNGNTQYNPYQQAGFNQQSPYPQYNGYSQPVQPNPYQQPQFPQWNNNWGQAGMQPNQFQQTPNMGINPYQQQFPQMNAQQNMAGKKFCKHCGSVIDANCIICPSCGKQVEELPNSQPNIVINNSNENRNINTNTINYIGPGKMCSKWVSFFLCFFLGYLGAHKFYEGKIGKGLLYLFTGGLLGFGWIIDTISILFKPDPYIVY